MARFPLLADLDEVDLPVSLPEALRLADLVSDSWPASMPVLEYARRKADLLLVLTGAAVPTYDTSRVGFWAEVPNEIH